MLYTIVNLLGLTISLAFILLLGAFISKQLNTDAFQEKADRIYVFADDEGFDNAYYLHIHLQNILPEIEASTSITWLDNEEENATVYDEVLPVSEMFVDSSFFDIFTIDVVDGNITEFIDSRDNIIVSQSFANKAFGDKNPIGKSIYLNSLEADLMIVAVIKDIENSILKQSDIILRSEQDNNSNFKHSPEMNSWGNNISVFLIKENADIKAKEPDVLAFLQENCWLYKDDTSIGTYKKAVFVPLREVYFHPGLSAEADYLSAFLNLGDWNFVRLLLLACLGLLFFAVMNYINLTVAQTGLRAKEMATRRLLGTSKSGIIFKMILESTILSAFAFIIALLVSDALSPYVSTLIEYQFTVWEVMTPIFILLCICGLLLLGVLSGLIPALTISKFNAIDVMKGSFRAKTKMVYSKIFITLQNVITFVMIVAALTIYLQINHMIHIPMNYETKDIYVADIWNYLNLGTDKIKVVKNELQKLPFVESVGCGWGTPLDGGNNNTMICGEDKTTVSFQIIVGDSAYFNIFGFEKKSDNSLANASDKETYYLNEYAIKELGIKEDTPNFIVSKDTEYERKINIAGIYYDFKIFGALRGNSSAMIKDVGEFKDDSFFWAMIIKTKGDKHEAVKEIEKVFTDVYEFPISGNYYEDLIESEFVKEKQLLTIIGIFTLIAILISTLGLLAISTYYVRQREKDISIRRVFGSTRAEIMRKLISFFMIHIGIAFVIGIPISYFLMSRWLEQYIYRISMYWWIFALTGIFVSAVAFATVFWQSTKAANANPAEVLKKE